MTPVVEQTSAGIVTGEMIERLAASARKYGAEPRRVVINPNTPIMCSAYQTGLRVDTDPQCPYGTVYLLEDEPGDQG
jgi:hypothetical protein